MMYVPMSLQWEKQKSWTGFASSTCHFGREGGYNVIYNLASCSFNWVGILLMKKGSLCGGLEDTGVWGPALHSSQWGCDRKGARPGMWTLPVSSPVSQCMLLLPGPSSSPQAQPSPPPVPTGPSKADFPHRRASRRGLQPGTGGRQGRQGKAEEAGEPASEGGCWAPASNWTENSPALTYRPGGPCGQPHTYTGREFTLYQQTHTPQGH